MRSTLMAPRSSLPELGVANSRSCGSCDAELGELCQEGAKLGDRGLVDRVARLRLAVHHRCSGAFERLPNLPNDLHRHDGVSSSVGDRNRRQRPLEIGLQLVAEASPERNDPRRPRPARPERDRVRQVRTL